MAFDHRDQNGRKADPTEGRKGHRKRGGADPAEVREKLIALAEPLCEQLGYDLIELECQREHGGRVVRLYIDVLPADAGEASDTASDDASASDDSSAEKKRPGVTVDDCATVSREFSALLDVEDPVDSAFNLEVSSPGVRRPLRRMRDYEAFVGERLKLLLDEPLFDIGEDPTARRKYTGKLLGADAQKQTISLRPEGDSESVEIPLARIRRANLEPELSFG